MDLNIRKAIMHNVSDNSKDQLRDTIIDAIQDGREKMLPGLGVFFELIWKEAGEQEKQEMVDYLAQGIKSFS